MKENKKVCIITTVHPFFDTRIYYREIKSLKNKYKVTYICTQNKETIEKFKDVKYIILKSPQNRFERLFKTNFKSLIEALKERADVYHFHDPELIIVGLLLKLRGKKVIYDIHEEVDKQILNKYWIPIIFRKIVAKTYASIEKLSSFTFDAIIGATPTISNKFKNKKIKETIRNFPILKELDAVKEKHYNRDKKNIVYIGSLAEERKIFEIVEALKYMNNVELILGGKFEDLKFEKKVKLSEGWKKVDYRGWVNRNEIKEILKNADLGLILLEDNDRFRESYPVKMFEYLASGTPILASGFPLWQKLLSNSECAFFIDPRFNVDELSSNLKDSLSKSEKLKRMGESGKKLIQEEFNWGMEEKKLFGLYRKILL